MSSKNNVNPGQYKVGGRERPGKSLGPERDRKEDLARSHKAERGAATKENRKKGT